MKSVFFSGTIPNASWLYKMVVYNRPFVITTNHMQAKKKKGKKEYYVEGIEKAGEKVYRKGGFP